MSLISEKLKSQNNKDHTQELNPLNKVYLLWYQLKNK
jgi:hypothetical protein